MIDKPDRCGPKQRRSPNREEQDFPAQIETHAQ